MGRYTARLQLLTSAQRQQLATALRQMDGTAARLVAYVVARPGATVAAPALRAHCSGQLPEYMVPSAFVAIDALPVGATGKVDRRALPDSSMPAAPPAPSAPPRGALEETLAAIWCRVLALPQVGRDDDFFADLGGHSLLAARLIGAIRDQLPVQLSLRVLFEQSTIARLAAVIAAGDGQTDDGEPAITRRARVAHRATGDPIDPPAQP